MSVNRNTFPVFSLIHYSCSIYVVLSREWSRVLICNVRGAAWPTLQITVSVIGDLLNYTSHRFYWFWNNKNYQITLLVKYWKLYICCPNTITHIRINGLMISFTPNLHWICTLHFRTVLDINKLHNLNIKASKLLMWSSGHTRQGPIAHNQ